jgi:hypothetical protein
VQQQQGDPRAWRKLLYNTETRYASGPVPVPEMPIISDRKQSVSWPHLSTLTSVLIASRFVVGYTTIIDASLASPLDFVSHRHCVAASITQAARVEKRRIGFEIDVVVV